MKYSREEIQQYIVEEEVKFIRMAFCDIYGKQKNISIMADEFGRAYGAWHRHRRFGGAWVR